MKKILAFFLAVIIMVSSFVIVQASSFYTNHTMRTSTSFSITKTGIAKVYTCYDAYEDVMTETTITNQKRSLLFFWNEVTTHTLRSTEIFFTNYFEFQLNDTGTYKCEVNYIISGTAGEADVLPFEDTMTY